MKYSVCSVSNYVNLLSFTDCINNSFASRMPFKIIQTIEAGEVCLSVVPSGWECNGILWWPKKHLVGKLSQIETSMPDDKWEKINCVKKREFLTRKEADDELDRMETVSDTEVEEIQMPPPRKRIRYGQSSKVFVAKDFNSLVKSVSGPTHEQEVAVNSILSPATNLCVSSNFSAVV